MSSISVTIIWSPSRLRVWRQSKKLLFSQHVSPGLRQTSSTVRRGGDVSVPLWSTATISCLQNASEDRFPLTDVEQARFFFRRLGCLHLTSTLLFIGAPSEPHHHHHHRHHRQHPRLITLPLFKWKKKGEEEEKKKKKKRQKGAGERDENKRRRRPRLMLRRKTRGGKRAARRPAGAFKWVWRGNQGKDGLGCVTVEVFLLFFFDSGRQSTLEFIFSDFILQPLFQLGKRQGRSGRSLFCASLASRRTCFFSSILHLWFIMASLR